MVLIEKDQPFLATCLLLGHFLNKLPHKKTPLRSTAHTTDSFALAAWRTVGVSLSQLKALTDANLLTSGEDWLFLKDLNVKFASLWAFDQAI